jgi:hypothetical protein
LVQVIIERKAAMDFVLDERWGALQNPRLRPGARQVFQEMTVDTEAFRDPKGPRILLAGARLGLGMDFKGVSTVIIFDVTSDPEVYEQRVRRVGRAGMAGTAITLATEDQLPTLFALREGRTGTDTPHPGFPIRRLPKDRSGLVGYGGPVTVSEGTPHPREQANEEDEERAVMDEIVARLRKVRNPMDELRETLAQIAETSRHMEGLLSPDLDVYTAPPAPAWELAPVVEPPLVPVVVPDGEALALVEGMERLLREQQAELAQAQARREALLERLARAEERILRHQQQQQQQQREEEAQQQLQQQWSGSSSPMPQDDQDHDAWSVVSSRSAASDRTSAYGGVGPSPQGQGKGKGKGKGKGRATPWSGLPELKRADLQAGEVLRGGVQKVMGFGAYCRLFNDRGVFPDEGLLNDPDVTAGLKEGDVLPAVRVDKVEPSAKRPGTLHILLSVPTAEPRRLRRASASQPTCILLEELREGDVLKGRVTGLNPGGYYVTMRCSEGQFAEEAFLPPLRDGRQLVRGDEVMVRVERVEESRKRPGKLHVTLGVVESD